MSAPEEKKPSGRRGAGRGRRQTPARTEQPPGPVQEPVTTPVTPAMCEQQTNQPGLVGRGRRRGPGPKGSPEGSGGSPERGSPKGSPTGSDIEDKTKALQVHDLAKRPGFGVTGTEIKVLANHFQVALEKELTVSHYHIDVTHERLKPNRDDKRLIFWTCVANNQNVFRSPYRVAYDGDHMCITLDRLNFGGHGENGEARGNFVVRVRLPRMEREEDFNVKVEAVALIHINLRAARAAGMIAERYTTPLHVLDLLFRQRRAYPLDENIRRQWFTFASMVYRIPPGGGGVELTYGRVIWQGLFSAARVGQSFTPHINFDVSHSGFYKP